MLGPNTSGSADKTYYVYSYTEGGQHQDIRAYGSAKGNATYSIEVDNNLDAL